MVCLTFDMDYLKFRVSFPATLVALCASVSTTSVLLHAHVWFIHDACIDNIFCISPQDLIGKALPRIGAYSNLDNSKQVVALVNDVSFITSGSAE